MTTPRLKQDVSGEAFYLGEFDDGRYHGLGKFFFTKGYVFTGEWHRDLMKAGEMVRLNDDSSISVYRELYDPEKDIQGKKLAVA